MVFLCPFQREGDGQRGGEREGERERKNKRKSNSKRERERERERKIERERERENKSAGDYTSKPLRPKRKIRELYMKKRYSTVCS